MDVDNGSVGDEEFVDDNDGKDCVAQGNVSEVSVDDGQFVDQNDAKDCVPQGNVNEASVDDSNINNGGNIVNINGDNENLSCGAKRGLIESMQIYLDSDSDDEDSDLGMITNDNCEYKGRKKRKLSPLYCNNEDQDMGNSIINSPFF